MRPRKFVESLTVKISHEQRAAIDALANRNQDSVGSITRELIDAGIRARGLMA
jgi:hypothetical protein